MSDNAEMVRLLRTFAPRPIHCTSRDRLAAILKCGAILPNDGTLPTTFGGPYYGMRRGYVCLFDFAAPTLAQCEAEASKWDDFFRHHQPVTVGILLDPSLPMIQNSQAVDDVGYSEKFFPFVEAWHDGPITRAWFRGYAVMCGARPTACRILPPSDDPLPAIDELIGEYVATYADAYAFEERLKTEGLMAILSDEQVAAIARDLGWNNDEGEKERS